MQDLLTPVLWVCYNPACGAPNQTAQMLFPGPARTIYVYLQCPACNYLQPLDYLQQFAPSATVEPEP